MQRYERMDGGAATLVLSCAATGAPRLVYFGAALSAHADLAALDAALAEGARGSTPDEMVSPTVFPSSGFGWMGAPAIACAALGGDDAIAWSECETARTGDAIEIKLFDERQKLRAELAWRLCAETGVLSARARVTNEGDRPFALSALASLSLPLPAWATRILGFAGDWGREARPADFAAPIGQWANGNRTGRTGFAGATFGVHEDGADELRGRVLLMHLGWSGSHRLSVETQANGWRHAQLESALGVNERVLEPGERHETPTAYACFSDEGWNGARHALHRFVRAEILPAQARAPRRVHFNSWEGVYFAFDEARLKTLASEAAALGVERFVLDDGWFMGRRHDRAGLGDWRVDPAVLPNGLEPLIAHVEGLGMDFGLWVEPEMVNPDSDLYRAHPDWCVHAPNAARPTMRNQLWLDLSRADVRDHVFAQLDALLSRHRIAYLKWDCNRFLFPAVSVGRPAGEAIVRGVYALMDRLREKHRTLEIESCASGGGRIDLEILRRASRVWASDATDAIERLRIQRWTNLVLPLEAIGAHVGPSTNPMTGRRLAMDFRAKVALFGHMGVELDPSRLDARDKETLARHIALYKEHRALLHSGRAFSWDGEGGVDARMVLAQDGSEALALLAQSQTAAFATSAPIRFPGLEPGARYAVRLLEPWPRVAARRLADADAWRGLRLLTGDVLLDSGLRLPLAEPETAWLVHFERRP